MTTFLRAAIMLTVLVGLPAGWIFYDQLPEEARHALGGIVQAGKERLGWTTVDEVAAKPQAMGEPNALPTQVPPALWEDTERAAIPEPFESVAKAAPSQPVPSQPATKNAQDHLEPLLRQLRELGASQYDLQTWGEAEQFYRFQCEMPLSQSSALTQQFEAVASDPHESIAQVVAEVAVWHADRQIR
ncbi:MAG: hypothetical protein RH917_03160 [Lacipirellulaceae bacterium]